MSTKSFLHQVAVAIDGAKKGEVIDVSKIAEAYVSKKEGIVGQFEAKQLAGLLKTKVENEAISVVGNLGELGKHYFDGNDPITKYKTPLTVKISVQKL